MPPLPSDGHGLDLTPYFTKYFLKYFLLGPCSYAIFMPDPAPVGCLFRSVPCSFFPFLPPILLSISLLKNACCNGCPRIIRACFCSGRTPPASSWRHQVTLDEIDADFVRRRGLPVVRRMTGGGAVYHDLGNLNFSFMENAHGRKTVDFARYLRPVCAALAELGVQASLTGRNDLEAGGRKISGSAQSLRQGRILHHGTLLVSLDFGELVQALHVDPDKIRSKGIASVRSRVANISEFWTPGSGMEDLRAALLRHCADGEGSLEPEVLRAAEELAERKYRSWDWNYGASPAFTLQRRERFPWGLVDWRLDVRDGMVRDCRICGDFFAAADVAGLEACAGCAAGATRWPGP